MVVSQINLPDIKICKKSLICTSDANIKIDLINKYSTLKMLQNVVSYCLRFIKNCSTSLELRTFGLLTISEIQNATNIIIKIVQSSEFDSDINSLKIHKNLPKRSKLLSLNSFLDEN